MKITFLVPFRGLSGGLKVISTYGNSFLRRGYDVTIIYPKRKDLSFKNRIKASIKNKFLKKKDHLDYFKGNLLSVESFNEKDLPISDIYIATGWQTADFLYNTKIDRNKIIYFVQHLETWDGDSAKVLDTYKNSKNIISYVS